jgi:hypothetical protein
MVQWWGRPILVPFFAFLENNLSVPMNSFIGQRFTECLILCLPLGRSSANNNTPLRTWPAFPLPVPGLTVIWESTLSVLIHPRELNRNQNKICVKSYLSTRRQKMANRVDRKKCATSLIIHHQSNPNQNHNKLSPYSRKNEYYQKDKWGQAQWLVPLIPATQEKIQKVTIQGQPWQKFSKNPSQIITPGMVVHICSSCYAGSIGRRIMVPGQSGQNMSP